MITRKLCDVRIVVIGSPVYFAERGEPGHPDELSDFDCIIDSNFRDGGRWPFQLPGGKAQSIQVKGRIRYSNAEACLKAAEAGLGLACVPSFVAAEALRSGRVQRVLQSFEASQGSRPLPAWPLSRREGASSRRLPVERYRVAQPKKAGRLHPFRATISINAHYLCPPEGHLVVRGAGRHLVTLSPRHLQTLAGEKNYHDLCSFHAAGTALTGSRHLERRSRRNHLARVDGYSFPGPHLAQAGDLYAGGHGGLLREPRLSRFSCLPRHRRGTGRRPRARRRPWTRCMLLRCRSCSAPSMRPTARLASSSPPRAVAGSFPPSGQSPSSSRPCLVMVPGPSSVPAPDPRGTQAQRIWSGSRRGPDQMRQPGLHRSIDTASITSAARR